MIPIIPISESRHRKRQQTKGRQVDPSALEAVRKLLGNASRQNLDAMEPDPVAMIHPDDLQTLGVQAGDLITIQSRRGEVCLYARADRASPRGAVFVAFCFYEAAINRLTNAALDPFGKIPEFKYCAVKLRAGGVAPIQTSFGGGQALAKQNLNPFITLRKHYE
jgi:formylmethanofuran dehydrogenase subunit D